METSAENYGTIQNQEGTDSKEHKGDEDAKEPPKTLISIGLQLIIYGLAIALLVLIFVIPSPLIDPKGEGHHAEHIKQGRQMVMRNIIYGTLAAGCLAYVMQFLKQPLILGYLLGGVLVGPIGLRLIIDEHEIATMKLGRRPADCEFCKEAVSLLKVESRVECSGPQR